MIRTFNKIAFLNKHDGWITYLNSGVKWIYHDKFKNLEFDFTDMSDVEGTKKELFIYREDIDSSKPINARPEFTRIIKFNDDGRIRINTRY